MAKYSTEFKMKVVKEYLQGNMEYISLAKKYNKSVAQIILRWDLQKGIATIPKSVNPERIKENSLLFDFELSLDDIHKIDSLNSNERTGADPNNFLDYFANKK